MGRTMVIVAMYSWNWRKTDELIFYNEELGWVTLDEATHYGVSDLYSAELPAEGAWIDLERANVYHNKYPSPLLEEE